MPHLFIANCTRKRQLVFYRLDFTSEGMHDPEARVRGLKQVGPIAPGQQASAGGDMHLSQIQSVMDQLSPCGGVGIEELSRLPKHEVVYVMSIGRQVPMSAIKEVHEHNLEILNYQGEASRRRAAIGVNGIVEQYIDATINKFDVEMEQMPPEPGEPDAPGKMLKFGVHVDRKAGPSDGERATGEHAPQRRPLSE